MKSTLSLDILEQIVIVWAPGSDGPQMELQIGMTSAGDQQMEAAWQP